MAADVFDRMGYYPVADMLTQYLVRIAYNQPHFEEGVDRRMYPWKLVEPEFEQIDEERNKHVRYHPEGVPMPGETNSDEEQDESIFAMHGEDPAEVGYVSYDNHSAGMTAGGEDDFLWDRRRFTGPEYYKNRSPNN